MDGTPIHDQVSVPESERITREYDQQGRLIQETHPDQTQNVYEYGGPFGTLTRQVDRNGDVTLYQRDERGNPTGIVAHAGTPWERTTWQAFDDRGLLVRHTSIGDSNTASVSLEFEYDSVGNMTACTDAEGFVTHYTYDGYGHLTSVSNADGGVWNWQYDQRGRCTAVTDPRNSTEEYEYDSAGHMSRLRHLTGEETTYEYDDRGRLSRINAPHGRWQEMHYDGPGGGGWKPDIQTVRFSGKRFRKKAICLASKTNRE